MGLVVLTRIPSPSSFNPLQLSLRGNVVLLMILTHSLNSKTGL